MPVVVAHRKRRPNHCLAHRAEAVLVHPHQVWHSPIIITMAYQPWQVIALVVPSALRIWNRQR